MHKLILWDIDGTLISSGGVAGECMRAAMEQVYGRASDNERRGYAGKTDQQIILETFPEREPAELLGRLEAFSAAYLELLHARRAELLARGRVLDGVMTALERIGSGQVVQSVLTGNLAPVARLKLELTGLLQHFDMEVGAFGSDHHRRAELVPLAAARAARRYGRPYAGRDVVVIGDTPNDIACGRAAGARTVAVATGPFSVADLAAHAPDAVLPSLADTDAAVSAILG
ncbi:MAG TPA: haloacid dehalogenase-like hydrolase [Roseiflexaceae bacterium]|nr:haloacid dehalogenase-like hydrolase [Roseiflexaceae bacterium]